MKYLQLTLILTALTNLTYGYDPGNPVDDQNTFGNSRAEEIQINPNDTKLHKGTKPQKAEAHIERNTQLRPIDELVYKKIEIKRDNYLYPGVAFFTIHAGVTALHAYSHKTFENNEVLKKLILKQPKMYFSPKKLISPISILGHLAGATSWTYFFTQARIKQVELNKFTPVKKTYEVKPEDLEYTDPIRIGNPST